MIIYHYRVPKIKLHIKCFLLLAAAETTYRKNAGKDGTVTVRVKNGNGVIEALYIGDKTIYEYLKTEPNK